MILNPSHEITLKGLPSDILDAYVRYKKGSRAIVAWLIQFGPQRYMGVKTLPIKELASLARSVTGSINELPDVVHFHFKETIAARKRLSQYFRKSIDLSEDDAETVNHEYFTVSLTKIYADLCDHCQKQAAHRRSRVNSETSAALAEPIKNHYACLPIEQCVETLAVDIRDVSCDECHQETVYHCPGAQPEFEIENDEMSVAIETASALERIHEILTVVNACWESAGWAKAHFVSAAAVTNVAWSALQELEEQLRSDSDMLSLDALHHRCCLFRDTPGDSGNALAKVHALLDSLVEPDRAITHYLDCHKLTVIAHCPSCVQKPCDYTQQTDETTNKSTTSFSFALVDNLLHLMCGARPASIILQSSPIFAEIGYLLTHRDDKATSFRCVVAVALLAGAYKAYLSALPKPNSIATCRITALKLSKQASSVIHLVLEDKDAFPCRCRETIAFHLSNLQDDMDAYAKHKCWDLYFQSPWVAGNHIIEMLDILSYYGMHLMHYRHYVASILHSYNVLIQFGGLQPILFLEQVCETFKEVFFPSGRPKTCFKNSWARYIGARLKFKKGRKRHGNDKDSWCMAVPAHAAKGAAGLNIDVKRRNITTEPKFDYAKIDPMIRLKQLEWRTDLSAEEVKPNQTKRRDSAYASRPTSSGSNKASPLASTETVLEAAPHPLQTQLTTLQTALAPTTTLAHLSIFHTCTNLIRTITSNTHDELTEKEPKLCICFAHTLLTAADRIVEGRKFGGLEAWKKDERRVVDAVKEALRDAFADENKVRKEWVWEL